MCVAEKCGRDGFEREHVQKESWEVVLTDSIEELKKKNSDVYRHDRYPLNLRIYLTFWMRLLSDWKPDLCITINIACRLVVFITYYYRNAGKKKVHW